MCKRKDSAVFVHKLPFDRAVLLVCEMASRVPEMHGRGPSLEAEAVLNRAQCGVCHRLLCRPKDELAEPSVTILAQGVANISFLCSDCAKERKVVPTQCFRFDQFETDHRDDHISFFYWFFGTKLWEKLKRPTEKGGKRSGRRATRFDRRRGQPVCVH